VQQTTGDSGDAFAGLLGALYEAATDAALWPAFLERFNRATGSVVASLHLHEAGTDLVVPFGGTVGCDAAMEREYIDYYASRNTYMTYNLPFMRTGFVGIGSRSLSLDDLKRTEYFDGWLRRLGVLDAMSACIFREGDVLAKLDFLRPIDAPLYGDAELAFTRRLLPHLQRATAIHRRLQVADLQQSGAEHTLDRLAVGVLLLDRRGRTTFANRSAQQMLAPRDGLFLDATGRLVASRAGDRSRLERLVAGACATGTGAGEEPGGALRVARPSLRTAFTVLVAPLRLRAIALLPEVPAAVVFLSNGERELEVEQLLADLYGLTRAEARVAKLLVDGLKVDEIANRQDVTTATVRTHVRRVLEKTETRGQSDLIRVLVSGPGAVRPRPF
jgi:DNA-binding CsgD family transcriptional regulator